MNRFLLWRSLAKWKAGDMPAGAAVAVGIADHMEVDGELLISSHMMSEREVDEAIDNLVAQLEKLRRKAKATIRSDNDKVLADLSKRNPDDPKLI